MIAKVSKNLATDLKIIWLDYQNNYVGRSSMMGSVAKNFNIRTTSLSVVCNYFNDPKLFSDLYLVKFLNNLI